ncbi:hypothetical protein NFI96_030685 [Prochilodus magdalenae]|nr:hypothetical protein NFI96_030685 [Prochilodus magdalenae]
MPTSHCMSEGLRWKWSPATEKRCAEDMCPVTPSPQFKSTKKKTRTQLFDETDPSTLLPADAVSNLTDQPPDLVALIHELRGTLRELCVDVKAIRKDMDSFQRRLTGVESELSAVNSSVAKLSGRTDILQAAQRQDREEFRLASSDIAKLQTRITELEDRNRLNNLRLVNLPENAEGGDAISFLQHQLPVWFPSLANREPVEIEWAHRVYSSRENSSTRPRRLIFKVLRYNDRLAILKAFRQPGTKIVHDQAHLLFFADYSSVTVQKRKAFSSCMSTIKQKGIPNFLLYPAKLKVIINSEMHVFSSIEEADRFIKNI